MNATNNGQKPASAHCRLTFRWPPLRAQPIMLFLMTLPFFVGCLAVSMHSTRSVQIRVTEAQTGKPVSGALVWVYYAKDWDMPVLHTFRVPETAGRLTGSDGTAELSMADYSGAIIFQVNSNRFLVTKQLIREGGLLEPYWPYVVGRDGIPLQHTATLTVRLTPKK